ncbi:hypothetical protein GCM10010309_78930 [Streptomyces violaceochromogenes]|nr:hypothetical protein GCM10010309_78930 [Streptomyces violaceochromogenes]
MAIPESPHPVLRRAPDLLVLLPHVSERAWLQPPEPTAAGSHIAGGSARSPFPSGALYAMAEPSRVGGEDRPITLKAAGQTAPPRQRGGRHTASGQQFTGHARHVLGDRTPVHVV